MDFQLPPELRILQDTVRRFVQKEMVPLERSVPEAEDIPRELRAELQAKAKQVGLWAMDAPEEFGGAHLGQLAMALVEEEQVQTTLIPAGAPSIFGNYYAGPLLRHGTPAQKEKYLRPLFNGEKAGASAVTEPHTGSDPASMETRAVRQGDCWVLNGQKVFITKAGIADFFEVYALTDAHKRARGGVTCFIIERGTPGFEVIGQFNMLGPERPGILSITDCRIPDSQRVGDVGNGFQLAQEFLTKGRLRYGAKAIGEATRALRMATEYAKERVTFGQPLIERQSIQNYLADSAVELHAARRMLYHAAWRKDAGYDIRQEASMVKYFACETGFQILDRALQIFGAAGLSKELPIERMFRDTRTWRILEGTSEIHRIVVARTLKNGFIPGAHQFG